MEWIMDVAQCYNSVDHKVDLFILFILSQHV